MTTSTAARQPLSDHDRTPTALPVSLPRLYFLRLGYLVMAVGLALTKWPLLLDHPQPWPLMDGVVTAMLVALSLLSLLGLRHPMKMLPILLFELGWKLIWVAVVVLPLWRAGQLDPATLRVFYSCLVVLIVAAAVPWRHVVKQYVSQQGDPWRFGATPASSGKVS